MTATIAPNTSLNVSLPPCVSSTVSALPSQNPIGSLTAAIAARNLVKGGDTITATYTLSNVPFPTINTLARYGLKILVSQMLRSNGKKVANTRELETELEKITNAQVFNSLLPVSGSGRAPRTSGAPKFAGDVGELKKNLILLTSIGVTTKVFSALDAGFITEVGKSICTLYSLNQSIELVKNLMVVVDAQNDKFKAAGKIWPLYSALTTAASMFLTRVKFMQEKIEFNAKNVNMNVDLGTMWDVV